MRLLFFKNIPLAIAYAITVLVVAPDAPLWTTGIATFALVYKFLCEKYDWPTISRRMTAGFSLVVFAAVYVQFRNILTQEAATALLLAVSSLKIIDYENDRDHRLIFILGFILLALKPLYSIDFYWLIPLGVCFTGYWLSLLNKVQTHPIRFLFSLFVVSIPLTLVLFFVFPRVVIPWAEAKASKQGMVWYSDTLNPGSISDLINSNILYFRARFFDSAEVRRGLLYWRGSVLTHPVGLQWLPSTLPTDHGKAAPERNILHYEIILEPDMNNSSLFGLERTLSLESDSIQIQKKSNGVFKSLHTILKQTSYEGYSSLRAYDTELPTPEMREIPKLGEKLTAWIRKVQPKVKTEKEKMDLLKNFFSDGSFVYTFHPGTYGTSKADGLDEFLFLRRKGFCEHYAGSYATMARALGVPSRVVVGFQGGSYNSFGDFWRISTKDAHAWAEVYIGGQWQRVDPTAWIAPLRIELGAESFFSLPEEERQSLSFANAKNHNSNFLLNWMDQSSNLLDHLNYKWTNFLLEYDTSSQNDLLVELKNNLGWLVFSLILLAILIRIVLRWLQPRQIKRIEATLIFHDICIWGQKRDLPRALFQTPLSYLASLRLQFPEYKDFFSEFENVYDSALYNPGENPLNLKTIKSRWNKIKRETPPTIS